MKLNPRKLATVFMKKEFQGAADQILENFIVFGPLMMDPFTKAKRVVAKLRQILTIFEKQTILCRDVGTLIVSY